MKRSLYGIFTIFVLMQFLLLASTGQSDARPTLTWEPSPGEVDGYNVYCWTISNDKAQVVNAGPVTQYSLDDLPLTEGRLNCFSVTAYNSHGESSLSNSACWAEDDILVPLPAMGTFGNFSGRWSRVDREQDFSFQGFGEPRSIRYVAFDVDLSQQIVICVNGEPIGYVPTTQNEIWGAEQVLSIPKEYLNLGENILTFANIGREWRWAVGNVEIE
jgi:hypothetical protein